MITFHIISQFYTKLRFSVLIFMKDIYCTGGIILLYRKTLSFRAVIYGILLNILSVFLVCGEYF